MHSSAGELWALTSGHRARYGAAITAMAIGTVFLLLVPSALKFALDRLASGSSSLLEAILPAALAIVGFNALHSFFTYLRGRWAAEASEGIVRGLRHRLYEHLERLPCRYHDGADTGDLVQRCSSDVETVRVFLAAQVVEIARVTLFLLVAIPLMLWQNAPMTLLSVCLVPFIVLFAITFFRRVRWLFEQVDQADGRMTTTLQENLTGIRVVRAFSRQDFEIEKFRRRNLEFRDLEFRFMLALSRYWALSETMVFSQIGIVLIGGAYLVQLGSITLGTWIFFFWLIRTIIWPVRHLGRVLADTGKAVVAIGRIGEVLRHPVESQQPVERQQGAVDQQVDGDIVIRDLTFSYESGPPALDGLSLTIRKGETIAILGLPGAGKSTLLNLLVRLYDYEEGSITIGGRELGSLNRDAVRNSFGMVLQDPFLYSRSVRDNLIVGNRSAAEQEIVSSARAADVHGNILDFKDGYETMVGERGVTLSGGQRQRLAIARALLKDPAFLVLDDSLSAVDTNTEVNILRALAQRRGRQTTILVSHRLSSTRLADRIFVLAGGKLQQSGTHEELVSMEGPYQRLWQIQGTLEDQISQDLFEASR